MEQVIFHPFWGVPDSIKKNEILPSLARGNTGVLERQNLRVSLSAGATSILPRVDWTKADMRQYHVYQPPGGDNVLGVVKFRFPNKHDVYMHDTPSKNLFNASVRAFSHGCMRVRDPLQLAELMLAEDQGWTGGRVAAAISSGPRTTRSTWPRKVPVHMTYFTAWVESDGQLKTVRRPLRPREPHRAGHGGQGAPDQAGGEGAAHGPSAISSLSETQSGSRDQARTGCGACSRTETARARPHGKSWASKRFIPCGAAFFRRLRRPLPRSCRSEGLHSRLRHC